MLQAASRRASAETSLRVLRLSPQWQKVSVANIAAVQTLWHVFCHRDCRAALACDLTCETLPAANTWTAEQLAVVREVEDAMHALTISNLRYTMRPFTLPHLAIFHIGKTSFYSMNLRIR